jgi:hypothetical protein
LETGRSEYEGPDRAGEDRFMKAASASTLSSADRLPAPPLSPAVEAAPFSTLAASLRGLSIGLVLLLISAAAGAAFASLTFGYPIGRLA